MSELDTVEYVKKAQVGDIIKVCYLKEYSDISNGVIAVYEIIPLEKALRDLAQYRQLIYGVLLVLLMMVKPQGLLGDINFKYIRQRMEHREKSKEAANE